MSHLQVVVSICLCNRSKERQLAASRSTSTRALRKLHVEDLRKGRDTGERDGRVGSLEGGSKLSLTDDIEQTRRCTRELVYLPDSLLLFVTSAMFLSNQLFLFILGICRHLSLFCRVPPIYPHAQKTMVGSFKGNF